MCYCTGEKETRTTHFRQDEKAQTLEKCTTRIKVSKDKTLGVTWQPPLSLGDTNIPIQVSQHLFLWSTQEKTHPDNREQRTEGIIVILALHREPNPAGLQISKHF